MSKRACGHRPWGRGLVWIGGLRDGGVSLWEWGSDISDPDRRQRVRDRQDGARVPSIQPVPLSPSILRRPPPSLRDVRLKEIVKLCKANNMGREET